MKMSKLVEITINSYITVNGILNTINQGDPIN